MTRLALSLAAAALASTTLPAQQSASTVPLKELSAAFASRSLSAPPHAGLGTGLHLMQGTAALNATKSAGHATGAAKLGAPATSASLAAFTPAAQSALAGGLRTSAHAPVGVSSPLAGADAKSLTAASSKASHAPAAKAKP